MNELKVKVQDICEFFNSIFPGVYVHSFRKDKRIISFSQKNAFDWITSFAH